MITGSRQRLSVQNEGVEVKIDDQIIKRVGHTKSMGVTIDAQLTWCKHVEKINKKVSSAIGALKREILSIRRKKRKALTMNGLTPEYLQRLFVQSYSNYNLRNSGVELALPKPRTNYLKRSFSNSRATLWYNLPNSLKNVGSVDQFKRNLKKASNILDPTRQSCKTVVKSLSF